jgi:hypothetical protein
MAWTHYLFVGPYAEWLTAEAKHFLTEGADPAWGDLVDGGALHWNISYATAFPPLIKRGRRQLYQYCCMPRRKRPGQPRQRMLFLFEDRKEPEYVADWTGVNSRQEIRWFRQAFAGELGKLTELFGEPPTLHWGLVYMQS